MTQNPPPNHQRIIPMLAYEDAGAAVEFLCKLFGFEEASRFDMSDGRIGHAELSYAGNVVMIASVYPEIGMASPKDLPALHAQVHCWVDDVDAHHAKAKAAGATIAAPPEDQFHGSRMYRAIDPEGHRWIFSTVVREVSGEEIQKAMSSGMPQDATSSSRGRSATSRSSPKAPRNVPERNTLSPYLLCEDLEGTVAWLERAFGFVEEEEHRVAGPAGRLGHTQMRVGNGTLLMGHPGPDYRNPKHSGVRHALMCVYVDDVDAHHDRAVAAGAEIKGELEDAFYGERRYSALDPEGHEWTFATPIAAAEKGQS